MSLNLETRKFNIIEQLVGIQDEAIILQIEHLVQDESTEIELLQALNTCVFPDNELRQLLDLREKREKQELSKHELDLLFDLIKKEEQLRLERINILGKLAQLRGVSLPELTEELGIQPQYNG